MDNQAGHIQAADLTVKTPNQLDNRQGTLQCVQKLQNSQGKIASAAGKVTLNMPLNSKKCPYESLHYLRIPCRLLQGAQDLPSEGLRNIMMIFREDYCLQSRLNL
ncbi:hypothetical protein C1H71_18980 [Iodobacter fluviatilis]|uniref:Uncharacterized protein n=1 Tax=Iodobacter fluviatilis TaxID=537 RepID=A0A7G3GF68_9NEIS|nr:hypothetical protein C1H71_18980 [Iodobacter fluviatilis]